MQKFEAYRPRQAARVSARPLKGIMICDSPAGMGGPALAIEGALCNAPRRPLFVATLRSVPSTPCTLASNLPAVIGPVPAKLGAGAVDTGGITRLAVSFDLVDGAE
jgi:hypothetical protein